MMLSSCDEPVTVVTNYVHTDGSVTRVIEMKSLKNSFELSDLQVPFDSTWAITDSLEINEKGDTSWIKRAEKLFKNMDEINLAYKNDSGANKDISRHAAFKKSFKWFNTEFRFSEKIDKKLSTGYLIKDFLNAEELLFFYSPEDFQFAKQNGPDSIKYMTLNDTITYKTDLWTIKNLTSMWIVEFSKLTEGRAGKDFSEESLKAREDEFVNAIVSDDARFDSLWDNGIFLKEFLGEENAGKYKTEADSALETATNNYFINFKDYSVRIVMPGKVIGSNGFIDSTEVLLWPVKSEYFLTEPYEMWAESKVRNTWAWVVTGGFILFVISGLVIRKFRKKKIT
jgi:hypothetical protein